MYAQLGNVQFLGLKGFNSFSDSRSIDYAEHKLIEGKPRLQRVGDNLQQLSLSILLHASFCNPESETDTLYELMENAEVLPLILGNGVYQGDFVIESINRDVSDTDSSGNVISQTLSLSLKEYFVIDKLLNKSIEARKNAFASSDGGVRVVRTILPIKPSLAKAAMLDVKITKMEVKNIDKYVSNASVNTSQNNFWSAKISSSLSKIEVAIDDLNEKIQNVSLNSVAGSTQSSITGVFTSVQNMKAALPITDINSVKNLSSALSGSVNFLNSSVTNIVGEIASRRM